MDEHDDPFRFCIYCKADCYVDEPEHTADCPQSTGLFPILDQDLGPKCSACGHQDGVCCGQCERPFALGDCYVLRDLQTNAVGFNTAEPKGLDEAPICEYLCLSCAALAVP